MKSPVILYFGIVLVIYCLICDSQCRITLDYPDMVSHYLYLRRFIPNTRTGTTNDTLFSTRVEEKVHILCTQAVENNKFIILRPNDPMPISSTEINDDIFDRSSISLTVNPDSTIAVESIVVPGIEGRINVIRCATVNGRSMYIENGTNSVEYFIFKEIEGLQGYKIELVLFSPFTAKFLGPYWDMLANPATRSPKSVKQYLKNERRFVKSRANIGGGRKTDICLLQGIDRLKVCSVLYQALFGMENSRNQKIKQYSIREKSTYNDCIRNGHVEFMDPQHEKANNIVRLVPCAVNAEWETPTFYVAAEQNSSLGVFIFSAIVGKPNQYMVLVHTSPLYILSHPSYNSYYNGSA